jgi:hypothetical protein
MKLFERLRSGCAQLSPNCREASRAQSEMLDHPLPPLKRLGLRLHLLICKWCRRYGKQIRFLRAAAHDQPVEFTDAGPQTLSNAARERIKRQLQAKK